MTDYGNARVQVFTETGVHLRTVGSRGTGPGQFNTPYDIAVSSPGGEILVTDLSNGTVQVFDSKGGHVQSVGKVVGGDVDFRVPQGVAVDSEGRLFVGCVYLHAVQMLVSRGHA